mgnify:CR=1 FL=1
MANSECRISKGRLAPQADGAPCLRVRRTQSGVYREAGIMNIETRFRAMPETRRTMAIDHTSDAPGWTAAATSDTKDIIRTLKYSLIGVDRGFR